MTVLSALLLLMAPLLVHVGDVLSLRAEPEMTESRTEHAADSVIPRLVIPDAAGFVATGAIVANDETGRYRATARHLPGDNVRSLGGIEPSADRNSAVLSLTSSGPQPTRLSLIDLRPEAIGKRYHPTGVVASGTTEFPAAAPWSGSRHLERLAALSADVRERSPRGSFVRCYPGHFEVSPDGASAQSDLFSYGGTRHVLFDVQANDRSAQIGLENLASAGNPLTGERAESGVLIGPVPERFIALLADPIKHDTLTLHQVTPGVSPRQLTLCGGTSLSRIISGVA